MTKSTTKQLLSRKAASEYLLAAHSLTIEASSLARYAYSGTGPRYVMVGARAMYAARDLDTWAQSRIRKPDRERRIAEAEKVAAPRAA